MYVNFVFIYLLKEELYIKNGKYIANSFMALRVIWQYMDRSVTKKILYGPKLVHIIFGW